MVCQSQGWAHVRHVKMQVLFFVKDKHVKWIEACEERNQHVTAEGNPETLPPSFPMGYLTSWFYDKT